MASSQALTFPSYVVRWRCSRYVLHLVTMFIFRSKYHCQEGIFCIRTRIHNSSAYQMLNLGMQKNRFYVLLGFFTLQGRYL
ncbi:unnamed protein product [Peronospora belbahrii]|uniref:Uncharacterized protein n=1 Tax=Peronospora belbahrii TaxID=622444 RepID=A0ABN8D152_9STRA|nr:unnamed protein product [Peronospora belbahrii]